MIEPNEDVIRGKVAIEIADLTKSIFNFVSNLKTSKERIKENYDTINSAFASVAMLLSSEDYADLIKYLDILKTLDKNLITRLTSGYIDQDSIDLLKDLLSYFIGIVCFLPEHHKFIFLNRTQWRDAIIRLREKARKENNNELMKLTYGILNVSGVHVWDKDDGSTSFEDVRDPIK